MNVALDPVTVPAYIVVAGYVLAFSVVSTTLTLFFRGALMSRRNHDEQMTYLRESRDEWKASSQEQSALVRDLTGRSVVLPTSEAAVTAAAQKVIASAG